MRVGGDRVGEGEVRSVVGEGRVEDRERTESGVEVEVGVVPVAEGADGGRVRGEGAAGPGRPSVCASQPAAREEGPHPVLTSPKLTTTILARPACSFRLKHASSRSRSKQAK